MATTFATSAPLLTSLRTKGSTFYTISTALSDIDRTTMDSNYSMAPSKFVCVRIPKWMRWSTSEQSIFEEPSNIGTPDTTDPNDIVPKMIQNYMENAIACTLAERTDEGLQTIAETMWWKMMKRMGGLSLASGADLLVDGVFQPTYVEDMSSFGGTYNRMAVYTGDINVMNHVTSNGQSYTEIFMHVPSASSMIDTIRFTDPGYEFRLEQLPEDGGPEYTVGLEDHTQSNTKAVYDTDDMKYSFIPEECLGVYFDELDAATTSTSTGDSEDFEFNAVLVYYDIWNVDDTSDRATNLYGVLFLDQFEDSGTGSYSIQTLDKYVANSVTTGNGYAIRLNLKTTSNQSQTTTEVAINDYSSVSMELYMTALNRLNEVTDKYEAALTKLDTVNEQYSAIVSILPRISEIESLSEQVSTLSTLVANNQTTYRISNEDLFEVFSNAVTESQSTSKSVNIQMVVGNYIYSPDSTTPYIVDPDGNTWQWDTTESTWAKSL